MWRGISLANKCLLLFGAAVVLIVVAALAVAWLRLSALVDAAQVDATRRLVDERLTRAGQDGAPGDAPAGDAVPPAGDEAPLVAGDAESDGATVTFRIVPRDFEPAPDDTFARRALILFTETRSAVELAEARWFGPSRYYQYARAVRGPTGAVRDVVLVQRVSPEARRQMVINTIYLLSAGLIALGLAVLVFYLITTRLILSPVRSLRDTAERVRAGELSVRSEIETGDEFEELSGAFNEMLDALRASQEQLRAINTSLDLKVTQLAQRNVELDQANRVKGEFLANVSHELRTPLNSIIGFAELLEELAEREAAVGADADAASGPGSGATGVAAKRRRYLAHILSAGRGLLELVNSLLEMARLEAGKVELKIERVALRDLCEAMLALMRPFADKNGVELVGEFTPDVPTLRTDPKKLQQILFNLLSNAVKFTAEHAQAAPAHDPRLARVTLRAERLNAFADEGPAAQPRVRVSVLDTGPGIAPEQLLLIFEKFHQLDGSHTRTNAGTGLGLAISRELAGVLQGEILVESRLGAGSMFSVILPLEIDEPRADETRLELAFRGALASQKE